MKEGESVKKTAKTRKSSRKRGEKAPKEGTVLCSLHGKMRGEDYLVDDGEGGFRCADGMECQMKEVESVKKTAKTVKKTIVKKTIVKTKPAKGASKGKKKK